MIQAKKDQAFDAEAVLPIRIEATYDYHDF